MSHLSRHTQDARRQEPIILTLQALKNILRHPAGKALGGWARHIIKCTALAHRKALQDEDGLPLSASVITKALLQDNDNVATPLSSIEYFDLSTEKGEVGYLNALAAQESNVLCAVYNNGVIILTKFHAGVELRITLDIVKNTVPSIETINGTIKVEFASNAHIESLSPFMYRNKDHSFNLRLFKDNTLLSEISSLILVKKQNEVLSPDELKKVKAFSQYLPIEKILFTCSELQSFAKTYLRTGNVYRTENMLSKIKEDL